MNHIFSWYGCTAYNTFGVSDAIFEHLRYVLREFVCVGVCESICAGINNFSSVREKGRLKGCKNCARVLFPSFAPKGRQPDIFFIPLPTFFPTRARFACLDENREKQRAPGAHLAGVLEVPCIAFTLKPLNTSAIEEMCANLVTCSTSSSAANSYPRWPVYRCARSGRTFRLSGPADRSLGQ